MSVSVRMITLGFTLVLLSACATGSGTGAKPASTAKAAPAPRLPDFQMPTIPPALKPTADVRDRFTKNWNELQTGSLRTANREFTAMLQRTPGFYPAETALGYAALADRQFKTAVTRFRSALSRDNRYAPAVRGLVEAELGVGNTDEAITALDRLIALGDAREADRTRLELLRLKQIQSLVQTAARAKDSGKLAEAEDALTRALGLSPNSALVLRDLSGVKLAKGELDPAEMHARRAVTLDPKDAGTHAALASVLIARGRPREAAAALARATQIDADCCAKIKDALDRLGEAGPAELRGVASAASVTRGQLAALIDDQLRDLLARAGRRAPQVATDLRGHWAAEAIARVTQAGVMDVSPNHTFQPAAPVRRSDLASIAGELIALALPAKSEQFAKLRAARPTFSDLPPAHLSYRSAALAVAAGVMSADAGRFAPTRSATGAEVLAALTRIDQLTAR